MAFAGVALAVVVVVITVRRARRKVKRAVTTDSLLDVLDIAQYRGPKWRPRVKGGRWWL